MCDRCEELEEIEDLERALRVEKNVSIAAGAKEDKRYAEVCMRLDRLEGK